MEGNVETWDVSLWGSELALALATSYPQLSSFLTVTVKQWQNAGPFSQLIESIKKKIHQISQVGPRRGLVLVTPVPKSSSLDL